MKELKNKNRNKKKKFSFIPFALISFTPLGPHIHPNPVTEIELNGSNFLADLGRDVNTSWVKTAREPKFEARTWLNLSKMIKLFFGAKKIRFDPFRTKPSKLDFDFIFFKYKLVNPSWQARRANSNFSQHLKMGLGSSFELSGLELFPSGAILFYFIFFLVFIFNLIYH